MPNISPLIADYIREADGDLEKFRDLIYRGFGYEPYRTAAFAAWEKHHNTTIK